MKTRIRNQHDSAVNPDAHPSQAMSSDQAIRWWNRPAAVRIGGIAGMLSPLPLLAASLITATAGQNLRQNGFLWAAVLAAILTALCVLGVTALHSARWAAPVRATGLVTSAALLGIAGFFMALGLEDLLAIWAGIPRFLSDNEVITGIGTLTGSVLTLVLAPFGLLVVGIAAFRSRLLSRSGRLSAVALGPCLILAALISDAASPLRSPQPGCRFSVSAGSCSAAASCAVPASHSYLERITPVSRRWPTVAASATVTTTQPTTRGRRWLRFAGHFVLMLAAMYVGMLTLYPAYNFLAGRLGYVNPISELPILSALVMALAMTLPMVALMRHQRHGWRPITEMAAAMVIPTLAASLCYLIGVIPAPAVMSVSHSTMIPAMLAVMLLRFDHYAGENHIRPK